MIGPYTREKIRNLNDHCNDDCNSSFECKILEKNGFVYKHMCAQVQRSRKPRLPKDDLDVFAYTRIIRTVI